MSEYICQNNNHNNPAYGQITIHFWDDSQYKMKQASLYICDKCGEEIISYLQQKFGKDKLLSEIIEM